MTNDELNEKIRQACTHAAPDVLDAGQVSYTHLPLPTSDLV